ncbi:hypothetical protein [Clostridium sp.]|uniref:hypothetical protein n=1 Tax=Clostridium sp. TaxID=1506 RepID=UPI003D6C8D5A
MLIKKCVIELENVSLEDLQNLETFLNNIKVKNTILKDTVNNDNTGMYRLKKFRDNLTEKQTEVFDFFMKNPGPIYGNDIREALPILRRHGALPGVFKVTKRWVPLGGLEIESPFFKTDWDVVRHCGKYRGLTIEEIKYLRQPTY